ncbi:hypothetical protein B0T16DRAFT_142527 [Cercophora newfieldiana]|uniref:Uncharacterized protein n=1 Tax=Cercophora newfieldiana TaxID=92897 RepID=A0AA40CNX5_9PEZI|nr:hypothetical protein B0T16DRAFT_142527 [Cercophora newfieldiana]
MRREGRHQGALCTVCSPYGPGGGEAERRSWEGPRTSLRHCYIITQPVTMAVKEHQELVNHCCSFCCKAVDFGTHDYCPGSSHCARCPY